MTFVGRGVAKLLREWRLESKSNHLCLYKGEGDTLIIYTDRPGYLIGRHGELVDKYRKKITEASFGTIKYITFVETYGIF